VAFIRLLIGSAVLGRTGALTLHFWRVGHY
jgi:hypothetical protein